MTVTTRAREALADCERALADYEAGANTPYVRSRWVAIITLLRAVGHVLSNVDEPAAPPEIKQRIRDAWDKLRASKPDPRIFHEFIQQDRNLTLKQYEVRPAVNITIRLGSVWTNLQTGESGSTPSSPPEFEFVMRDGPFKGRNTLELCRDAITFWRQHLDAIESGT
jgi:hypothetical protein